MGAEFRELYIAVGEGGLVHAWWLPADADHSAAATLLYLRGNDANLGLEVDRLDALRRHGLAILAIDYRGYGRSSGPAPSEAQVYEDATAAWDYLIRMQGVDHKCIVLYGHSLGGAVAAELALRRGPACGIVFEGAFTSMAEMARLEYPTMPIDWLLRERFDTLSRVGRLDVPMIFVHGTADQVVPPVMTEQLYQAARGDKQLVTVDGAGHEDALLRGGTRFSEALSHLVRMCSKR